MAATNPQSTTTTLPVTRVVLYASGASYVVHSGSVRGNATIHLPFTRDQLDDITKSIVVMDTGGTQAARVRFPTADDRFDVEVPANPSLPQLLEKLRGAELSVSVDDERISGCVVGVESGALDGQSSMTSTARVTLLGKSGVRVIPINRITRFEPTDSHLNEELAKAIARRATDRSDDRCSVEVQVSGEGSRRIRIGYLIRSASPQVNYRLDMSGSEPVLQGWSVIQNDSQSDWEKVAVEFSNAQPLIAGTKPTETAPSEFKAMSTLDIPRGGKVIVPILQLPVSVTPTTAINIDDQAQPMHAVELTAENNRTLPVGPVSVYAGGVYAGQGMLSADSDNATPLLKYAIDSQVAVNIDESSAERVSSCQWVDGQLRIKTRITDSTIYKLSNQSTATKRCTVEHPIDPNTELVTPDSNVTTTSTTHRMVVTIEPGGRTDCVVKERSGGDQVIDPLTEPIPRLRSLCEQSKIQSSIRDKLDQVIGFREEVMRLQARLDEFRTTLDTNRLERDQVMKHLEICPGDDPLARPHLQRLARIDGRIEKTTIAMDELTIRQHDRESELVDFIRSIKIT